MSTTDLAPRPATELATFPSTARDTTSLAAASTDLATDLATVVDRVLARGLGDLFDCMGWADEEIEKARARNPDVADRLHHSFGLLTPTNERMATEFVYRSHCRELLDRIAAGGDTRPGTAAEVCCATLQVSKASPLRPSATGLCMRMWLTAGFPDAAGFVETSHHHEALERSVIDDHEQFARRKLAVADRRLGNIDCRGYHHGQQVNCRYAPTGQFGIES